MLAALHRTSGGRWREEGVDGRECVYVTAETHSSLAKAARVAGLGGRALRVVDPVSAARSPCRPTRSPRSCATTSPPACARCWCARPSAPPAPAPSTPSAPSPTLAREHGAWVHVDAAWAGVAALCPEHRDLLDGVELADSFCTDAHKWLLTAFDASLLWVRDARALPAALSITPEYLRNAASDSGAVVDYRDWQVSLGRRFRALKLWAVLHTHGLEGLRTHIRGHVALAAGLADRVAAEPGFALAAPPSLALVCLRCDTGDPDADDRATRALLARGQRLRAGVPHAHGGGRSLRDPGGDRRGHDGGRGPRRAVGPAAALRRTGGRAGGSGRRGIRRHPARLPPLATGGSRARRDAARTVRGPGAERRETAWTSPKGRALDS